MHLNHLENLLQLGLWAPPHEFLIQQVWGGVQESAFSKKYPSNADSGARTRLLELLVQGTAELGLSAELSVHLLSETQGQ